MIKILFISHDASRSGAPILLLNFINWLKSKGQCDSIVILLDGGPLVIDFKKAGKVLLWSRYNDLLMRSKLASSFVIKKILNFQIKRFKSSIKNEISLLKPDLIYFNTVATYKFYNKHQDLFLGYKLILHIHEMPFSIKRYVPNYNSSWLEPYSKIITVNSLSTSFIFKYVQDSKKVLQLPEYLNDIESLKITQVDRTTEFTVLGVGYAGWRKGTDLFVKTAYYFSKKFNNPFVFKWVGDINLDLREQLKYDLKLMGIETKFEFIGPTEDMQSHYSNCDVFFLSSREDPYPLVMLEAASWQKPIVYFAGSGGATEFVGDYGKCVESFDPVLAAEAIYEIYLDYDLAVSKSKRLAKEIPHHAIDVVGEKIIQFICQ